MDRNTPTAILAVFALAISNADTKAVAGTAEADRTAALAALSQLCMLGLFGLAKIEVRRHGRPDVEVEINIGDGCGVDVALVRNLNGQDYGPWMLELRETTKDGASGSNDVVDEPSCSALTPHMSGLHPWSHRKTHDEIKLQRPFNPRTMTGVEVGQFVVKDWSGMFDLNSKEDRIIAARWVRETLLDIRPCWDNFRQDSEQSYIVGRLYADIASGR